MEKGINDRSALIKVLGDAPAVSLITADNGDVIGVVVNKSGKELRIRAKKAVILASGGYEYGKEMRKASAGSCS